MENISNLFVACSAACSVFFLFLTYLFYEISKNLRSRIAWVDWILILFRKIELLQIVFILAFAIVLFDLSWTSSIKEGLKEENGQIEREKQKILENLDTETKENMALKDEKRLAFQPVRVPLAQASVVKAEPEESQDEIVSAVEKMKQTENVSNSVKTEAKDETDLAKIKAQIDAIQSGITAMKAQVSAQTMPGSADAGTSEGKTTEVVATMN